LRNRSDLQVVSCTFQARRVTALGGKDFEPPQ
jgi:hypothetical protein